MFDEETLEKATMKMLQNLGYECVNSNNIQNEILLEIWDTLLPKLMNGEIDLDKMKFS